jgi:DNA-binding XRE family transcriptional regulator
MLTTMPSGRSFYQRSPERYAAEKEEFKRLVSELKRLAWKRGYTQGQIASEVGVSSITVKNWWTGHSLTAKRESIERLKKYLATH